MESDVPGCLIAGRYRLGAVVGRGGMGVVWQARDELLGRDVAVKELTWPEHVSAGEREAARRHAVREARAAARLSHRNVIQVFDIVEEDGCPWIVMELIAPRSLRDLIDQEGPLGPAQAARLGLEILAALGAAHRLGIVHRDAPGTGSCHLAAGLAPGTHLTSRTLPAPSIPVAGSVSSEVRAQPDNPVPPGHSGKPGKPGKGKGKGG